MIVVDGGADCACALFTPAADNISATVGGVTTAKRPAFSRKSRRLAFDLS